MLYFCKKINDMEETKHIKISDYNYPLPDERIAKFPLRSATSPSCWCISTDKSVKHISPPFRTIWSPVLS